VTTRRDFTDVRDVTRAYRAMVTQGELGSIYNVCSGRSVELIDIATRLLALAGVDLELVTDQTLVRSVEVPAISGSFERLHHSTGWEPVISLETTLSDVLAYWEATADAPSP
jgi:GDP-4-dehydro-6-deoxy-D-mannose reductase